MSNVFYNFVCFFCVYFSFLYVKCKFRISRYVVFYGISVTFVVGVSPFLLTICVLTLVVNLSYGYSIVPFLFSWVEFLPVLYTSPLAYSPFLYYWLCVSLTTKLSDHYSLYMKKKNYGSYDRFWQFLLFWFPMVPTSRVVILTYKTVKYREVVRMFTFFVSPPTRVEYQDVKVLIYILDCLIIDTSSSEPLNMFLQTTSSDVNTFWSLLDLR